MCYYEGTRRQCYDGGATFVPVCQKCGRYVKADETITTNGFGEMVKEPNATCTKCGRTHMIFEGYC